MRLSLFGEDIDFNDDDAIRSHVRSYATAMVDHIRDKRLRDAFEGFFADAAFVAVKAGAVLSWHQHYEKTGVPIQLLEEILVSLNSLVGLNPPTSTYVETPDEHSGEGTGEGEGTGAGDRAGAAPDGTCEGCDRPADAPEHNCLAPSGSPN